MTMTAALPFTIGFSDGTCKIAPSLSEPETMRYSRGYDSTTSKNNQKVHTTREATCSLSSRDRIATFGNYPDRRHSIWVIALQLVVQAVHIGQKRWQRATLSLARTQEVDCSSCGIFKNGKWLVSMRSVLRAPQKR